MARLVPLVVLADGEGGVRVARGVTQQRAAAVPVHAPVAAAGEVDVDGGLVVGDGPGVGEAEGGEVGERAAAAVAVLGPLLDPLGRLGADGAAAVGGERLGVGLARRTVLPVAVWACVSSVSS